jgi:hypothetical protein
MMEPPFREGRIIWHCNEEINIHRRPHYGLVLVTGVLDMLGISRIPDASMLDEPAVGCKKYFIHPTLPPSIS